MNMNGIKTFKFEELSVRTLLIGDKPFFIGKDVAEALGYKNSRDALSKHVDSEDKNTVVIRDGITKGNPNQVVINESGVYSLIFASKLPSAKRFRRWVTSEVLPTIRKHGAYMTDQMIEEVLTNPDTIIKLATQLKTEREGRLIAEQRVNELTPKATYYDQVLNNKALINISVIAKDYGYSAPSFNKLLHELGVQYKQGNIWLLYSKYQRLGWTQSETKPIRLNDGTEKLVMHTKWTQKGRLGLYELLKKHDILPLIEQDDDVA